MFKNGDIIRHKAYRDVCFQVLRCFNTGTKLKIKGHWINMGYEQSWIIDRANITIELKDRHDWYLAVDPQVKCLRTDTDWIKL